MNKRYQTAEDYLFHRLIHGLQRYDDDVASEIKNGQERSDPNKGPGVYWTKPDLYH